MSSDLPPEPCSHSHAHTALDLAATLFTPETPETPSASWWVDNEWILTFWWTSPFNLLWTCSCSVHQQLLRLRCWGRFILIKMSIHLLVRVRGPKEKGPGVFKPHVTRRSQPSAFKSSCMFSVADTSITKTRAGNCESRIHLISSSFFSPVKILL